MLESLKRTVFRAKLRMVIKKIKIPNLNLGEEVKLKSKITINSFEYSSLFWGARKDTLKAVSICGGAFLKISLFKHERKKNALEEEVEVIKKLNNQNALSCPKLLNDGKMPVSTLVEKVEDNEELEVILSGKENLSYFILEYIDSDQECYLPDLVFTLLEQKSLGVYQGDVKPENIRFSKRNGILYLIDYDQAHLLTDDQKKVNSSDFFQFCDDLQKKQYGERSWLRFFRGVSESDLRSLFENGSFNLQNTFLYRSQETTNTINGVYHTLKTPVVFADGVRDMGERAKVLDNISFEKGERTLDIGCNVGLLSMYLSARGCVATGFELDSSLVRAATMIDHILGNGITFKCVNLDQHDFTESFDTVMLFSVFHHTKNMIENGRKIAANCRRVVVECRLVERGHAPDSEGWERTSKWNFSSYEELYKGLEEFFPGFKLFKDHGQADKGRNIIELRKEQQ